VDVLEVAVRADGPVALVGTNSKHLRALGVFRFVFVLKLVTLVVVALANEPGENPT
jgi:hypothetical protein